MSHSYGVPQGVFSPSRWGHHPRVCRFLKCCRQPSKSTDCHGRQHAVASVAAVTRRGITATGCAHTHQLPFACVNGRCGHLGSRSGLHGGMKGVCHWHCWCSRCVHLPARCACEAGRSWSEEQTWSRACVFAGCLRHSSSVKGVGVRTSQLCVVSEQGRGTILSMWSVFKPASYVCVVSEQGYHHVHMHSCIYKQVAIGGLFHSITHLYACMPMPIQVVDPWVLGLSQNTCVQAEPRLHQQGCDRRAVCVSWPGSMWIDVVSAKTCKEAVPPSLCRLKSRVRTDLSCDCVACAGFAEESGY